LTVRYVVSKSNQKHSFLRLPFVYFATYCCDPAAYYEATNDFIGRVSYKNISAGLTMAQVAHLRQGL